MYLSLRICKLRSEMRDFKFCCLELGRGAVRGFLVKRDRVFLFSVIRVYEKILSVNCE